MDTAGSIVETPFRHLAWPGCLEEPVAAALAQWLQTAPGWGYQEIRGFYQQWRLRLEANTVPEPWQVLFAPAWVDRIRAALERCGTAQLGTLTDISANRMDSNMFMKMHTDVGGNIAARLVVQLSCDWNAAAGGLLVLSSRPDDVERARLYVPQPGFGFGFQIDRGSYHAVTRLARDGRYTLAYSFASA